MNSAYVVGATFTIENLASPQIGKLAAELKDFNKLIEDTKLNLKGLVPPTLKTQIGSIGGQFDAMAISADKASTTMVAAMDRAAIGATEAGNKIKSDFQVAFVGMDEGMVESTNIITQQFSRITRSANRSTRAISDFKRDLAELSTMSNLPLPQLSGPGGGGGFRGRGARGNHGGGNGSNGGFHYDMHESVNTPAGRVSGRGAAGAAIAGAFIVGDAIYTAAELEDIVTKVIITSQKDPGQNPLSLNQDAKSVAGLIKRGAVLSGASIGDVGDMVLSTEREFQGFTFEKKLSTMEQLMPAIAAEARLRHESLEEAGKSLVGILHQSGLFTPEEMVKGAREYQFTTMATPVGLGQFQNALSYSMPLHNQIGMDTGTIMLMTAQMQASGITNSKSGTWLDAMFSKAQVSTDVLGPLKKEQVQHNAALKMLGLVGEDGKQNWHVMGADGKEDWNASVIQFGHSLHDNQEKIPASERNDVLERAFGKQGARAASLFSQENILDQLKIGSQKEKAFVGGDLTLSEYNKASTLQSYRIAVEEFQTSLATLGTQLLPTVNSALKGFSSAIEAIPGDWEKTKQMWGGRLHPFAEAYGTPAEPGSSAPHDYGQPDNPGGLFQLNSWDGTTGGVSNAEDTIYRGTLRAFSDFASGKGVGGSSAGGGGFINASYETDGGSFGGGGVHNLRYGPGGRSRGAGGSAPGGLSALSHGAVSGTLLSRGDDAMAHLMSMGVSREAAAAIVGNAQQESSITGHGPMGDHGTAGGMFQWRFDRLSALKSFAGARGTSWQDEHTQLDFMVAEAKQRGNSSWLYGHDIYAANQGMQRFEQYGESADHGNFRTRLGNANMWNNRAQSQTPVEHHITIQLDKEKVGKAVVKTMASNMKFPRSMGSPDGHSTYISPGTPVMDAA